MQRHDTDAQALRDPRGTIQPHEIHEERTYLVSSVFEQWECAVSGPLQDDDGVQFFIVESADGGFDIEWRDDHWDGGGLIGVVHLSEVNATV